MERIDRYRRFLKRRNFSSHTVKSYLNILFQFTAWLTVPLREVTRKEIGRYVDHLMGRRLSPKTITCHLQTIRLFFTYLIDEEEVDMANPVTKVSIRLPKPLPRHLTDDQVTKFLAVIEDPRDRAMFMLMVRCGLRVEEVSRLTVDAVDIPRRRLFVANGKGRKDRVVYLSEDTGSALTNYLKERSSKTKRIFLVQKGPLTGTTLSVRGIQKRIEYYARVSKVTVSCHSLRHTMATQLLNADADLATIQDLLGHTHITTTQRYCRVSNVKAQRDYYTAIELVMQRSQRGKDEESSSMMSRKKTPGRRPDQREIRVLVPTRKDETPEQGKNAGYTAGERRETSVPQFPADVKHEPGDGVSEEAMRNDEFRYRRYPERL